MIFFEYHLVKSCLLAILHFLLKRKAMFSTTYRHLQTTTRTVKESGENRKCAANETRFNDVDRHTWLWPYEYISSLPYPNYLFPRSPL